MSSFSNILELPGALLLLMTALLLMIGQTAIFLLCLRERAKHMQILTSALNLALCFLFFVVVLDRYDMANLESIPRDTDHRGWWIYSLPWLVYAALEALFAIILGLCFRAYRLYKTSTVTPHAIRQSVDMLPEGICVSAADGTVLLANLKINTLCRSLTGERLANSLRLWSYLEEHGEGQGDKRLIHTPQGEVWLFSKEPLTADGENYTRTSAADVTERYRITEELREKNEHLQEIQRRMKEAAELSGEMFLKQEEAKARSALHNELGQVLLMGRHSIEHPESTDRAMVALLTRQMNSFLLGESNAPEEEAEDEVLVAIRMAASIGVQVELRGETAKEAKARLLLAAAIRECAANAVKHAEGDRLRVEIREDAGFLRVRITNNGKPPKGTVAESGGLLSLRRSVEAKGGRMTVESLPNFSLVLELPNAKASTFLSGIGGL